MVYKKRNIFENRHLIFILLLVFSLLLIVGKKVDTQFLARLHGVTVYPLSTILDDVVLPWRGVLALGGTIREWRNTHALYQESKTELNRLQGLEIYISQLELENLYLRQQLNYPGRQPSLANNLVTARVLFDNSGLFSHSLLVDVGDEQGINKEYVAISQGQLVGRVVFVDKNVARILLASDFNSRIAVFVGENKVRALLAGNNSSTLRLTFLPNDVVLKEGMEVITSGHGGIFPPALSVGRVVSVNADNEAFITLNIEDHPLHFVLLLHYKPQAVEAEIE